MSKTKKRTKTYHGTDAAPKGPRITRYKVTDENIFKSWWKEHKTQAISRAALMLAALLASWIIYSIIR